MSTAHFHELTTDLIRTIGETYEQLVAAYDPDDIMAATDELILAAQFHLEQLEREAEFPTTAGQEDVGQYE